MLEAQCFRVTPNGAFTLPDTKTDTDIETDKMGTEPNRNLYCLFL